MSKRIILIVAVLLLTVSASCAKADDSSSKKADDSSKVISSETDEKPTKKSSLPNINAIPEIPDKNNLGTSQTACDKDAEETLKKCMECMFCSKVEETLKFFYPTQIYDAVINGGGKDNFKLEGSPDNKVSDFHMTKCSLLADTGCAWAEKYFNTTAENNGLDDYSATVTNGYDVQVKFKVTIDGEKETLDQELVVVEVKDEGWKVIPMSMAQLKEAVEK